MLGFALQLFGSLPVLVTLLLQSCRRKQHIVSMHTATHTIQGSKHTILILTSEAASVLLSVAVHLALMAGQNLLHQVQHPKVLHNIVQQNRI